MKNFNTKLWMYKFDMSDPDNPEVIWTPWNELSTSRKINLVFSSIITAAMVLYGAYKFLEAAVIFGGKFAVRLEAICKAIPYRLGTMFRCFSDKLLGDDERERPVYENDRNSDDASDEVCASSTD